MTTEEHGAVPLPDPLDVDPVLSTGMGIAARWGEVLGPEKLQVAMVAVEKQLKREHEMAMRRLDLKAEAADRERREERAHRRHMAGLAAGVAISSVLLGAGVYVARDAWWLATLLCGPSLLALAKIFVLRRSDPDDMKVLGRMAQASTASAERGQQPPPVL